MSNIDVKIIELKPARMLSFYGYGSIPEDLAWGNLVKWVKENNFIIVPERNRIYGFNNPCPSVGSMKYGYEYLMSFEGDVIPHDNARVVDFPGGIYAVAKFDIQSGEEIPGFWKELSMWCESSIYSPAQHQCLEEHTPEGIPFALYLPVKE